MNNVYFMGGSPCCGKSTIAEHINKKYGFQYYKPDNFLSKYIQKGKDDGDEWLKYIATMPMDKIWLKDPKLLNKEELLTYERLFPYFISDLNNFSKDIPIITEGTAFLPSLMDRLQVDKTHYICIVPTKEFQMDHYKKRPWINDYLSTYSNKEKAFNNWMERDSLFALAILNQAKDIGYETLIVDGQKNVDENLLFIEKHFQI